MGRVLQQTCNQVACIPKFWNHDSISKVADPFSLTKFTAKKKNICGPFQKVSVGTYPNNPSRHATMPKSSKLPCRWFPWAPFFLVRWLVMAARFVFGVDASEKNNDNNNKGGKHLAIRGNRPKVASLKICNVGKWFINLPFTSPLLITSWH